MLGGLRSGFLLSLSFLISTAHCVPVHAQVNGVPASVTSPGFGGRAINGVPASVTSLGPNGYSNSRPIFGDCCANFFLPGSPTPRLSSGHRRRRDRDRDKDVVTEPVYIPYAAPAAEEADDDSPDADYPQGAGPLSPDILGRRARNAGPIADAGAAYHSHSDEPVAAQRSTVLIFKDGHRSEVENYAVVGNTLFDFATDRTHKIPLADLDLIATQKVNEDRGVDFQIPDATSQQ